MSEATYKHVNDMWEGTELPPLDYIIAVKATKDLWKKTTGREFPTNQFRKTSGNRNTWPTQSFFSRIPQHVPTCTMKINPGKGWRDFVHLLSHLAHHMASKANHGKALRGHHWSHASWERAMIAIVKRDGWLERRAAVKVIVPVDKVAEKKKALAKKIARTEASLIRWSRKAQRAETAIRKLQKELVRQLRTQEKEALS